MVSIQIKGISNVALFLKKKNKEAINKADKAVKKAGFFIENEVDQSIAGHRAEPKSVDTGFFLRSILAVFPKQFTANIGSNKYPVEYGVNLEYGTSRMRARHHFKNTKVRNEKKIKEFIEKEISTL